MGSSARPFGPRHSSLSAPLHENTTQMWARPCGLACPFRRVNSTTLRLRFSEAKWKGEALANKHSTLMKRNYAPTLDRFCYKGEQTCKNRNSALAPAFCSALRESFSARQLQKTHPKFRYTFTFLTCSWHCWSVRLAEAQHAVTSHGVSPVFLRRAGPSVWKVANVRFPFTFILILIHGLNVVEVEQTWNVIHNKIGRKFRARVY